jgi:hypothetical protein
MYDLLVTFCKWLENTWWGTNARVTLWAYPFIQLIHFSGISLWLGTNVAVDLRLLGLGRKRQTAAQLSQDLFAWNWTAFCIVILGGFLLFSATATTFVVNPAFRIKLGILVPLAVTWHIIVQSKTRTWGLTEDTPAVAKLAGLFELLLWLSVVTAAVEIPNY